MGDIGWVGWQQQFLIVLIVEICCFVNVWKLLKVIVVLDVNVKINLICVQIVELFGVVQCGLQVSIFIVFGNFGMVGVVLVWNVDMFWFDVLFVEQFCDLGDFYGLCVLVFNVDVFDGSVWCLKVKFEVFGYYNVSIVNE